MDILGRLDRKWRYVLLVALALFFSLLGIVLEQHYYGTSQPEMDVRGFTETLHRKEALANETLKEIRTQLEADGLSALTANERIYRVSEENDMTFLVYLGDTLIYWSNDIFDVYQVSKFPFKRNFMMRTNSAYNECIQLFSKRYRCLACIKIKDCVYPKFYSKNNNYAKGFDLPGNVQLAEEGDKEVCPIYNSEGAHLFSLVRTPIFQLDNSLYWLCIVSWFIVLMSLFRLLRMFCAQYRHYVKQLKGFLPFSFLGFGLLFLFSYFRIPEILYSGMLFSEGYYASSFAPSFGHLLLYTIYGFSCLVVACRHVDAPTLRGVVGERWRMASVLALQLLSSAIYLLVYLLSVSLIYRSKIDVAFVFVRNVSVETIVSLLLISSWFLFWALCNAKIRKVYSEAVGLKQILQAKLVVAVFWLVPLAVWGGRVDCFLYGSFFVITLYIDIYRYYYRVSFIYVTALVFLFLNAVIAVCYWHSEINNDMKCFALAKRMNADDLFLQDRSTETFLRSRNSDLVNDRAIAQLMNDSLQSVAESRIEQIVRNHYFERFWNLYDISVQVCAPKGEIAIRKGVYGDVVNKPAAILKDESKFVRLENTNFYKNKDERLSVCYVGDFLFGGNHLYIKLFPNIFYNRISFLERLSRSLASNAEMISSAKYHDGELSFVSGDYRYPNSVSWISDNLPASAKFSQNGYDHYVCRFDAESVVVVSKERQQSYAFIILLSYMFSAYLVVALLVMLVSRMKRSGAGRSLLTRMQMWFVIPLLFSSLILGSISVYYFYFQYRNNQMAELGRKADSVQQSLQARVGMADRLSDVPKEELRMFLYEISNLFRLDVVLYDTSGVLCSSSLSSSDMVGDSRVGRLLMSPRAHFARQSHYYQIENKQDADCVAYYVRAYNRKNVHLGYLSLISSTTATQMKSEMMNNIVIVVDLYLVIMLLSIFVIWLINKKVTKPIVTLSESFDKIKLTGKNVKIDYDHDDEIGRLVSQYNKMVDELMVSAEKLARSEREFAWREMARRIAHEIKNPLTPMKLSVQMTMRKRELDPEGFDEYFKKTSSVLIEQIDNLSRIASEFSNFAKTTQGTMERIDLVAKLASAVSLFENNMEGVTFELELNGYEHASIMADGKQLLQVFNNLFRNAIQAIPSDRKGEIRVAYKQEGGMALIEIRDNGCGIPDEIKDNLFLPNFTTKTSGMGLGLAIVKNIVNSSNGVIWFESELNEGTTFFLKFPLVEGGE